MKIKKLSLAGIKGKLGREEMKKINGGNNQLWCVGINGKCTTTSECCVDVYELVCDPVIHRCLP